MGNKASLKFQRLPTQPLFSFTENNLKKNKNIQWAQFSGWKCVFDKRGEWLDWFEVKMLWCGDRCWVEPTHTCSQGELELKQSGIFRRERCLIGGDRNWSKHYLWKAKSEASRQIFNQSYSCDISMLLLKLYSLRSGTLSLSGQLDRERSAVL